MCIFCSWPLFENTVYHYLFYRMHLGWPFLIFLFLLSSFFKKVLPAFGGKHNFENRTTPFCIKNTTFWIPSKRAKRLFSSLCPFLSLLCSFGSVFFSLHEHIKSLTMTRDLCIFSLQSPISKKYCMHRTCSFVKFACHLLFSLCL